MLTHWQGQYLDGKTALTKKARVTIAPGGLEITPEASKSFFWPFEEIAQTQGFHAGEAVRLENGIEAIVIRDPSFLEALQRFLPGARRAKFHNPETRKSRGILLSSALALTIAIIAIIYLWGIEAGANVLSAHMPVSWEEKLGKYATGAMLERAPVCRDAEAVKAVDMITRRLAAASESPYRFEIYLVENDAINAFAAPGGRIIVFTGLLELTDRPEELAGVLAHEMQHITKKHATKSLIQNLSAGVLISAITGATGAGQAAQTANSLMMMKYGRALEEEADKGAVELLIRANADTAGMAAFFERLNENERPAPALLKYLQSHPQTSERIDYLKRYSSAAKQPFTPLLPPDTDWESVASACSAVKIKPSPAI